MTRMKLAFPFKGHRPGDVVEVPDDEVRLLVGNGIGHPEGLEPVLRLGRLPQLPENPEPASTPQTAVQEASKRRGKTPAE
ncbi:hypothetical protein [Streptomyces sp. CO7]